MSEKKEYSLEEVGEDLAKIPGFSEKLEEERAKLRKEEAGSNPNVVQPSIEELFPTPEGREAYEKACDELAEKRKAQDKS